jgi:membrane-bound lytic murein transglycosylase D
LNQEKNTTVAAIEARKVVRKVGYVVRKGDSLHRIADKFSLKVSDIEKWNTLPSKYLQPGDRLTLYVDVTRIQ